MKGSNFILIIASFVFVSIFALALVPDDFWEHDLPLAEMSQLPQVSANNKNHHLARNNTNPAINSVITGKVAKNQAVNSGINFNGLLQPIAFNGPIQPNQTQLLPDNKFSFASRNNSLGLTQANPTGVFNNVAFAPTVTKTNPQPLDIRTGPPIMSDSFPPPTHNDGRNQRPCSLCHVVTRTNMAAKERMFNNQTKISNKTLNYQGMVQQLSNRKAVNGWNRVHVWIRNQRGQVQEIILAPSWFLDFVGCSISKQQNIKGVAFDVTIDNTNTRITQTHANYAKNIIVNGTLCRLRSDKGLPLWSN